MQQYSENTYQEDTLRIFRMYDLHRSLLMSGTSEPIHPGRVLKY